MEGTTLVLVYHQTCEEELPNPTLHTAIHATVENQIALGNETPVKAKSLKLMPEGLDRHEAVHAIGSVLVVHPYDLLSREASEDDLNVRDYQALEMLRAESWRRGD